MLIYSTRATIILPLFLNNSDGDNKILHFRSEFSENLICSINCVSYSRILRRPQKYDEITKLLFDDTLCAGLVNLIWKLGFFSVDIWKKNLVKVHFRYCSFMIQLEKLQCLTVHMISVTSNWTISPILTFSANSIL